jgi:hypothetical protein
MSRSPLCHGKVSETAKMKQVNTRRLVIPLVLGVACIIALVLAASHRENSAQKATSSLSACFPLIEKLLVTNYRNQDWCKNIAYSAGRFSNSTTGTCDDFTGPASPFTVASQKDFDFVAAAIAKTGVPVNSFTVDFSNGIIKTATFDVAKSVTRFYYVYSPNYGAPPPDKPREQWHTPIDKNWYLAKEDWN